MGGITNETVHLSFAADWSKEVNPLLSDGFQISYYTGSIEDKQSNKYVVDILEGTKRAFNNRKGKYF